MNVLRKVSREQILGVMVDGRELKVAHLGRQGGEIVIHALESATLHHRLGRIKAQKATAPAASEEVGKDVFGLNELPSSPEESFEPEPEEGDVSTALVNVFSRFLLQKTPVAVNIPEGQASYFNFESDFGLKGKKLFKRLREEISPLVGGTLDTAALDYFKAESGELTVVVSEGSVPLIDELLEVRNFLPNSPIFCQVGANEIALVNLVRMSLDLPPDTITAIIYIGCDFSRVIMMRGEHPLSFVQAIREGYQAPQICQTLFSKILLEQEEAGLLEINQIVLTGEIGVARAFDFFSKQFPEAKVQLLTPGPLNTQFLEAEQIAVFPNYAIPVALAWEVLEKKNPRFIRTDLIPASIKDRQKVFKVAWHGFALLGLIFVLMVLLSYQGLSRWNSIKALQESVRRKQETVASLQPELTLISQLQSQIGNYRANLAFLDSLVVDPGKWSRLLGKLALDFQTVNRIWIENIKSDSAGFNMIGKALNRDRIPKLAAGFPGADLKRATRVVSEEGEVTYEFEMTAGIPPPDTAKTRTIMQPETDRVNSPRGSIPAAAPTSNEEKPALAEAKIMQEELPPPAISPTLDASPAQSESGKLYLEGIKLIRAGEAQDALGIFESLLQKFPQAQEVAAARYWIGECHYAQGDYVAASEDFKASLEHQMNTKREAALLMLGLTYQKMGQDEQARMQFESLLQEFPNGEFSTKAKAILQELSTEG